MSNNNQSGASIVTIVGSMVMLYIAASVMLSSGNTMGSMFYYMLIAGGVFGLLSPKKAFFLFMLQCACLDLAKRLMIFGGTVSREDLYYVLGIAPVTVAGIAAGLIFRVFFGQLRASGADFFRLALAGAIMAAGAVIGFRGGGGMSGMMKTVADGYFYGILIFVMPLLFPTALEIQRLWKVILWLFIPVAIYGIYQQLYGFQEFEIEYLSTGLSIEVKQIGTGRVRAFSMLNSPTSLSLICGELAAISLLLVALGRKDRRLGLPKILGWVMAVIFIGGWLASTVRVGILVVPVALAGYVLFRSSRWTLAFYATGAAAFATLIASASYILQNVETWTMRIHQWTGNNEFMANMLDANTYKDRLMGFVNVLGNPDAYSLFGIGEEQMQGDFYNHDPLSSALVKFGAVALGLALIFAGVAVRYLHRCTWGIRDPGARHLSIACLAVAAGSVAVSMVGGNLIATFPGNAFLAMPIGMVIALHRSSRLAAARARKETPAAPAGAPPLASPWAGQRAPWQAAAGSFRDQR
jgi:hypothetical protein